MGCPPSCVGGSQDLGNKGGSGQRWPGNHSHPLVLGWESSPGATSAWTLGPCCPPAPGPSSPSPGAWGPGCCPYNVAEHQGPRKAAEWALSSLGSSGKEERQAPEEASCAWSALVPLKSPLSQRAAGGTACGGSCESWQGHGPAKGSWHSAGLMTAALGLWAGRPSHGGAAGGSDVWEGQGGENTRSSKACPSARREGHSGPSLPVHDRGHVQPLPPAHDFREGAAYRLYPAGLVVTLFLYMRVCVQPMGARGG